MANNVVQSLAQLYAKDPKRANWLGTPSLVGTNDFGFIKVRHTEEIIPSTVYDFNFKCAFSSNPTISPVISRAKVTVCGIWIPLSLYIPALRDGAEVTAMETDYAFPTINFQYKQLNETWNAGDALTRDRYYYYIPANSIFTELNMFEPYYTPVSRFVRTSDIENTTYPKGKNAIPLLGYYDFYRHFILNTQQEYFPLRLKGFSRRYNNLNEVTVQEPTDAYFTRKSLDALFQNVRKIGSGGTALQDDSSYPMGDDAYDVTPAFSRFYYGYPLAGTYPFAPVRSVAFVNNMDHTYDRIWFNDDHFGEVRATYFSDFNTAFMSNENIAYERSTAKITVDDEGSFTMEALYAAEKVQDFYRRSIFKNNDYSSFISAETGITPPTNLTKPLFLGSVSTWINYNDVVSQAQTGSDDFVESNTSLGSRASLGFGRMATGDGRSFVRFTAKEPGYFMLLEWIVPEVSYWQGYNPMYDKTTLMSLYYPSFDRSGFQDQRLVHLVEQIHKTDARYPFASMSYDDYDVSLMQVPAYWEHMTYRNRLAGQMVDASSYLPWTFHRDYDLEDVVVGDGYESDGDILPNSFRALELTMHVTDNSVVPEQYHNIYANTEGLDNLQCYYKFNIKRYQPLSHRFLSF